MAKVVNATLYFSELEWRITTELNIDVVETCRTAIKTEIRDRTEVREIVNKTQNIVEENSRLREENNLLKEQLRTIPPSQPERMAILQRFGYR
jgi:regulator of replication initiation timing